MIRYDCLELLAGRRTDQLVLTSLSGQRIEWAHLSNHGGDLLVGQLGCALGIGMGLALALPHRKIIVLESDGSVLLSLFNLATLGNLNIKNLVVFVFDNQVYSGTRISYPSATAGNTDLTAVARATGIKNAMTIRHIEEFKQYGLAALDRAELGFFVCKVEESLLHRQFNRPTTDLAENKYAFVRYLERTENKAIPLIGRG